MLSEDELALAVADAAERVSATEASDDIILQFKFDTFWLWRQWKGTVLEAASKPLLAMLAWSVLICGGVRLWCGICFTPGLFMPPPTDNPLMQRLSSVNVCFNFVTSLTTFIITFFLGQTYSYWRTSFGLGRSIQGRLHDISLLLVAGAKRDADKKITPESAAVLADTARNCRLLSALFWMSNDDSLKVLRPWRPRDTPAIKPRVSV